MTASTPSSPQKTTRDDLDDSLLIELECPVCTKYMIPPITFCENGHNICSGCRPKIKKCPTCRKPLLSARNLALENLAKRVKYPCCNRTTGCNESFPLDQIIRHQNVCLHEFYNCPLAQAPGILCHWRGPRTEVRKHIDTTHKERVTEAVSKLSVYTRNFNAAYKYCRIIYALGEIFYQQFDVIGQSFYFVVQYVGPEDAGTKYRYEFTLESSEGDEKIEVFHIAQSVNTNIDDIRKSRKCVKLHYDVVRNFLKDNSLKFEMEISEVRGILDDEGNDDAH